MNARKPSKPTSFLKKAYKIVDDHSEDNIISWTNEGNAFVITDPNTFTESILPKFFKHKNFSSFVRQLNMYDFHKEKSGSQIVFFHEFFKRNRPSLLSNIKRKNTQKHEFAEQNRLKERVNLAEEEQASMDEVVKSLEQHYSKVFLHNQSLITKLVQNHQKEKRIQSILCNYAKDLTPSAKLPRKRPKEVALQLEDIQPVTAYYSDNSENSEESEHSKDPQ